ncbi:hypothetical protein FISHEDRAFT_58741 [Fistulina hepatica ATCC 64428]|uniref:RRM domain-containing protein n=1 Tax=Fistulina hepatica ATCC 64428 TaxID=1128425 RepID=A0A0D7AE89_9AGAR|nr:hypothetical protein FISHEDRAFT_58741 [Fistulina hepatica ATCC 64428]
MVDTRHFLRTHTPASSVSSSSTVPSLDRDSDIFDDVHSIHKVLSFDKPLPLPPLGDHNSMAASFEEGDYSLPLSASLLQLAPVPPISPPTRRLSTLSQAIVPPSSPVRRRVRSNTLDSLSRRAMYVANSSFGLDDLQALAGSGGLTPTADMSPTYQCPLGGVSADADLVPYGLRESFLLAHDQTYSSDEEESDEHDLFARSDAGLDTPNTSPATSHLSPSTTDGLSTPCSSQSLRGNFLAFEEDLKLHDELQCADNDDELDAFERTFIALDECLSDEDVTFALENALPHQLSISSLRAAAAVTTSLDVDSSRPSTCGPASHSRLDSISEDFTTHPAVVSPFACSATASTNHRQSTDGPQLQTLSKGSPDRFASQSPASLLPVQRVSTSPTASSLCVLHEARSDETETVVLHDGLSVSRYSAEQPLKSVFEDSDASECEPSTSAPRPRRLSFGNIKFKKRQSRPPPPPPPSAYTSRDRAMTLSHAPRPHFPPPRKVSTPNFRSSATPASSGSGTPVSSISINKTFATLPRSGPPSPAISASAPYFTDRCLACGTSEFLSPPPTPLGVEIPCSPTTTSEFSASSTCSWPRLSGVSSFSSVDLYSGVSRPPSSTGSSTAISTGTPLKTSSVSRAGKRSKFLSMFSCGAPSDAGSKRILIVRGLPRDPQAEKAVVMWCRAHGDVQQLSRGDDGASLHVEFADRQVADRVCRIQGQVSIKGVGSVTLDWYTASRNAPRKWKGLL